MDANGEKEGGKGKIRVWTEEKHTAIYKIDKHQGYTIQHSEFIAIMLK